MTDPGDHDGPIPAITMARRAHLRVRGRRPFDIGELSGRAGQSMHDWLESGISAFERWLAEGDHLGDESKDASAESVVHGESHRRVPSLIVVKPSDEKPDDGNWTDEYGSPIEDAATYSDEGQS